MEADLGRLSGRLSQLFTLNYARASLHRDEIHETLFALEDLLRRVPFMLLDGSDFPYRDTIVSHRQRSFEREDAGLVRPGHRPS